MAGRKLDRRSILHFARQLPEPRSFDIPIIGDPVETGWMFAGVGHVWRTKTHGIGSMSVADYRQHCNEWTGDFVVQCGDWVPLGPSGTGGYVSGTSGVYTTAAERTAVRLGDALGGGAERPRRHLQERRCRARRTP